MTFAAPDRQSTQGENPGHEMTIKQPVRSMFTDICVPACMQFGNRLATSRAGLTEGTALRLLTQRLHSPVMWRPGL
jgi:hypothetical protein